MMMNMTKKKIVLMMVIMLSVQLFSCFNGLNDALDDRNTEIKPWVRAVNPASEESQFLATAIDSSGYIYAVGYVVGNGQYKFGEIELQTAGRYASNTNCVIVKYTPAGKVLWAKTVVGSDASRFLSVATDPDGNIYAVGIMLSNGAYNFGSGPINGAVVGLQNGVIVKYNSNGENTWVRTTSSGSNGGSYFYSVAVDSKKNIYVAGYLNTAGPLVIGAITKTCPFNTGSNAILVKFDSAGTCVDVKTAVTAEEGSAFVSVAVDNEDNVYIAGNVKPATLGDSYDFGSGVFDPVVVGYNSIVVKYSATGSNNWVKRPVAAASTSAFLSVANDSRGDVYAVGFINGNDTATGFDFGSGKICGASAGNNAVIVKYDSSGMSKWVKTVNTGAASNYTSLAINSDDNIYSVGSISGVGGHDFGTGLVYGKNAGFNSVIVKYNSSGNVLSVKTVVTGPGQSDYRGVAADRFGSIYCSGFITNNGIFNFGSNDVQGGHTTFNALLVKYRD